MSKQLNLDDPKTQLEQVIAVASTDLLTLKEIQQRILERFNTYHQETSISARIRQANNEYGFQKKSVRFVNPKTKRAHYRYMLSGVAS